MNETPFKKLQKIFEDMAIKNIKLTEVPSAEKVLKFKVSHSKEESEIHFVFFLEHERIHMSACLENRHTYGPSHELLGLLNFLNLICKSESFCCFDGELIIKSTFSEKDVDDERGFALKFCNALRVIKDVLPSITDVAEGSDLDTVIEKFCKERNIYMPKLF